MGRPKELTDDERADLLAQGYRPFEFWLPDLDDPAIRDRLKREAEAIAAADARDPDLEEWIRQVRGDLWDEQTK